MPNLSGQDRATVNGTNVQLRQAPGTAVLRCRPTSTWATTSAITTTGTGTITGPRASAPFSIASTTRADRCHAKTARLHNRGSGFYNGGKGVLMRNPFDGYEFDTNRRVVPASFIVDDLIAPNKVFPRFRNGMGFGDCSLVYVVGSRMADLMYDFDHIQTDPKWGWGVFYPWDANAADSRCEYHSTPNEWYDCPGAYKNWGGAQPVKDSTKHGAGWYSPGNPNANASWGGGAGCHFSALPYACSDGSKCTNDIDQVNRSPKNLVGNKQCECNYLFNDNWEHWVESMGSLTKEKANGHVPEAAMCWVNNLKDMMNLQNALWKHKATWFSEGDPSPAGYWGWNEVPVGREQIANPQAWDAVVIKLPLYVCGGNGGNDNLGCLSSSARGHLEDDISEWVSKGKLVPGAGNIANRPGAYVVLMREWADASTGNSCSWFFCQSWTSPNNHWKIVYNPMSQSNPTGACWLDKGDSFKSSLLKQTFKAEVSRSSAKAHFRSSPKHIVV